VDVRDGSRVAHEEEGRNTMLAHHALRALIIGSTIMSAASGMAAEVTPERLANPEPGNWLTNHRTYDTLR
jgi:hypothetical protein